MSTSGTLFDALLVRGAVVALGAAALWLVAVVVAVAVEARTGGRLRFAERAGCPRVLRLWLLALFVAMFAGVAPAQAGDHGSRPERDLSSATLLDGLQLPDRPEPAASRHIVVRAGDTLWGIARREIGRTGASPPTSAAVAAAVARLHAVNRRVIGPDADLIRPGQHLTIPEET